MDPDASTLLSIVVGVVVVSARQAALNVNSRILDPMLGVSEDLVSSVVTSDVRKPDIFEGSM